MKNLYLLKSLLSLFFLTILFFSCQKLQPGTGKKNTRPKSEALEILQFLNWTRSYPATDIPEDAYTRAYMDYKAILSNENRRMSGSSPWQSLGPVNVGGRTLCMAFDPLDTATLWMGSASGGLWKSTTGGTGQNAWTYIPTGFDVRGVSAIAINPDNHNIMYIGTGETYSYGSSVNGLIDRPTRGTAGTGILKSNDGGSTWLPSLNWQYQQVRGVWDIVLNPLNPDVVYAGTTEGVYKSNNGGTTWFQVLQETMVMDLLMDPVDTGLVYAAVGNAGSPNPGIYRTSSSGAVWTRINSGLPAAPNTGRITLAMNPLNHRSVLALVANFYSTRGIYQSFDEGLNWNLCPGLTEIVSYQGWYAKGLCFSPDDTNLVMLGGVYLFMSDQGGAFPYLVANPHDIHADIHDILFNPLNGSHAYILTDGGLFRSNDSGFSFYDCNDGYVSSQSYIGSVSSQDPDLMLAGLQDNNTILYDGSPYWIPVTGGDGSFNAIDPSNDFNMFTSLQYLNIFMSMDRGSSFFTSYSHTSSPTQANSAAFIAPFILCPSAPATLYAGCDSLLRSDDGGFSWFNPSGTLLDSNNLALSISVSSSNEDSLYVCTAPNPPRPMHVLRSTDGGQSFQDISGGLPNRFPRAVTTDPINSRIVYVAFSGFGTGHLFRSTDAGNNWSDIRSTLPDIPFHCILVHPQHPDTLFAGSDLGVFVSADAGQTWDVFNDQLPEGCMVFDLKYSPSDNSLICFTHGNGIYKNSLGQIPVSTHIEKVPFILAVRNNPATEYSSVLLISRNSGECQWNVFNAAGELIHSRRNTCHTGRNQILLDLSNQASGLYFLSVELGNTVQTVKLMKQ
ncbi:MAG: T9SS type A sorting domain-containing protein [Bacteroidia bacterium]|nr:T9SS type A sorting domain-containing protein [Bacteroidia bacterium]